jgi:hypothetical protein
VNNVVTVKMSPNATYPHRTATFVRVPLLPNLAGVVEIRESRTPDGKTRDARYALREETEDVLPGDRVFRLTKPGGAVRYYVCLPSDVREFPVCGCTGYERHGWCKHIECLRALIADGHLKSESF